MGIPKEVVQKAFQAWDEESDLGEGYRRVDFVETEFSCGHDCCGSYVESVTILTPEGVEVVVWSTEST